MVRTSDGAVLCDLPFNREDASPPVFPASTGAAIAIADDGAFFFVGTSKTLRLYRVASAE